MPVKPPATADYFVVLVLLFTLYIAAGATLGGTVVGTRTFQLKGLARHQNSCRPRVVRSYAARSSNSNGQLHTALPAELCAPRRTRSRKTAAELTNLTKPAARKPRLRAAEASPMAGGSFGGGIFGLSGLLRIARVRPIPLASSLLDGWPTVRRTPRRSVASACFRLRLTVFDCIRPRSIAFDRV